MQWGRIIKVHLIWDPYEEDVQLSEYSEERVSFKSSGIIYQGKKVFSYYYE